MRDACTEVMQFLTQHTTGKATVPAAEVKKSFHGRPGSLTEHVKEWAKVNGLSVTGDRPDLAASRTFYFRRKPL